MATTRVSLHTRIDDEWSIAHHADTASARMALKAALSVKRLNKTWRIARLSFGADAGPEDRLIEGWKDGDVLAAAEPLWDRCAILSVEPSVIRLTRIGDGIARNLGVPKEMIEGVPVEWRGDARYADLLAKRVLATYREGPTHWRYSGSMCDVDLGVIETFMFPLSGKRVLTHTVQVAA